MTEMEPSLFEENEVLPNDIYPDVLLSSEDFVPRLESVEIDGLKGFDSVEVAAEH